MSEVGTGSAPADGNDAEFAQSVREGDVRAYAALWRRHAGAGRSIARRYAVRDSDADDLVAEAFTRILRALRGGGGPRGEFRPYLAQTIRNVAADQAGAGADIPLDSVAELAEAGSDPAEFVPDNALTRRAFRSLPGRWRTVLWYSEVEGLRPDEVAPILGLTPANASALAYRAREGLRRAWLQAHIATGDLPVDCRWATERMAAAARDALSSPVRRRFDSHVAGCRRCTDLFQELRHLNGRLAVLILPVALGAGALPLVLGNGGAASAVHAAALRTGPRQARLAIVTAGVVVVLASVTAVAVAAVFRTPAPPVTAPSPQSPGQTGTGTPNPAPTPILTSTPGPTAPGVPPSPRDPAAPPPPDRTPPAVPTQLSIADGTLLADATPGFTGRAEPGARIEVHSNGLVGTTMVQPDGTWSVTLTALPDGVQTLVITAIDAAGNRSAPLSRTVTIDTVALAPVLDPLPASPLTWLPRLTGTGEVGAIVAIIDESPVTVASTTVAADGTWAVDLPDPLRDGSTLTAHQTDPAGNTSPDTTVTAPIDFVRPWFAGLADGDVVPSSGGATVVTVHLAGTAGMQVEVFIDGVTTGNTHTLDVTPIDRVTPALADGPHTLGVRYVDPATDEIGSIATVSFTIS